MLQVNMFGDAINATMTSVRRSMAIIAAASKNTASGRKEQKRSSMLNSRKKSRKDRHKSWVLRDIEGASEGEVETSSKRSKR